MNSTDGKKENLTEFVGKKRYDFRSDTLTLPSVGMKHAMMNAELGDDVYEEDPSVKVLQDYIVELTGHASAMFGVTGTMMNQVFFHFGL